MANILLIEPDYKCKYPPLGLMKIAYYHKEIKKDFVWFTKGRLPYKISEEVKEKLNNSKYYQNKFKEENLDVEKFISNINEIIKNKKWDRVYVTTLFTYEYKKTIEAINYAKEITNRDFSKIIVGGISATLLDEKFEKDTGIKPVTGQLVSSSMIGYDDNVDIDKVTPDYSILDNIEYEYQNNDAYYAYTTRGCGMKCGFCAVQKLEPQYEPHISIKKQILEINDKYGEKKDLLLMDNNVLKSSQFEKIIKEIIDLGFEKGAVHRNSKTGKDRNRYVDFNQGLDAKLFTEEKIKLLSKIAIRPARIAFDHIEDEDTYIDAIKLAANNGITNLSNYILYNAEDFTGKGKSYKADTPEDLYNRLEINVKLQEFLNQGKKDNDKIHIFSFPMRYIPLEDIERGYVGTNWTTKYLRAVQAILIPTQGKGVSSKSFFDAAFGKSPEEFKEILLMPENYIATRGEPDKIRGIDEQEREKRREIFEHWESLRNEWRRLYNSLNEKEKKYFENKIANNEFSYKIFKIFAGKKYKKLYIHYFTENTLLLEIFENLYMEEEEEEITELKNYFINEGKDIYLNMVKYVSETNTLNRQRDIFIKIFKRKGIMDILNYWLKSRYVDDSSFKLINQYRHIVGKDFLNVNKILWILKEKIEIEDMELIQASEYIVKDQILGLEILLNNKMNKVYKRQIDKVKSNILSKEKCLGLFKDIYSSTMYKPN